MTGQFASIADFILETGPADIPADALQNAALLMLDTAGIAAASTPMQAGRIARETALALYSTADPAYQARMMFDGRITGLAGAAYAGATQTDNLDGHDGFNAAKGHVGVAVLPALAALMQTRDDMSGPQALAHVVVAYEIACRAALALHATVADYHTSGAWNALGVVAMGARMRELSRDHLRQALGIAEYHGPRSQMMREIANPTMLHDGSGMGALVGVSSVVLAEKGFAGAPAITVEAAETAKHWADLGSTWLVTQQYIKPYPICRWAHAPIDAVRAVVAEHGLTAGQIDHIHINTFHEGACLFADMPTTTSQAQYSLQFALAAWLIHGHIGLDQISGYALSDPMTAAMVARIEVGETEAHNSRFPDFRTADAIVTLRDGQVLRSGDIHALGGSENPMSHDEILAKFNKFAAPVLGVPRADALQAAMLGLSDPDSRLSALAPLMLEPVTQ